VTENEQTMMPPIGLVMSIELARSWKATFLTVTV